MQRVQKQGSEPENAQRTAQAKFTSKSRENEQANAIDDSPAMIAQRKKLNSLFGSAIQRQGAEEEMLQGKFDGVQRVEEEEPLQGKFEAAQRVEEEEPLQGKFEAVQRVEEEELLQGKFEATSSTQLKEEAAKPNNTGLPDNLKSGIESLSGMSMDNVKVHYNSSQPAQLNALAYAQGTDIHVAPGQEQHLPHEAWHVVQQAQGRVKPTMQMKEGVPVNDDKSLEHEADVMGARGLTASNKSDVRAEQSVREGESNELTATQIQPNSMSQPEQSVAQAFFDLNGFRTARDAWGRAYDAASRYDGELDDVETTYEAEIEGADVLKQNIEAKGRKAATTVSGESYEPLEWDADQGIQDQNPHIIGPGGQAGIDLKRYEVSIELGEDQMIPEGEEEPPNRVEVVGDDPYAEVKSALTMATFNDGVGSALNDNNAERVIVYVPPGFAIPNDGDTFTRVGNNFIYHDANTGGGTFRAEIDIKQNNTGAILAQIEVHDN